MALHSLYCVDVPLRNCSLTHSLRYYGMPVDRSRKLLRYVRLVVATAVCPTVAQCPVPWTIRAACSDSVIVHVSGLFYGSSTKVIPKTALDTRSG